MPRTGGTTWHAPADHRAMRRVLRREVAGTVGLLADEHDFAAMRALPQLHLRRPHAPTSDRSKPCSGPSPPRATTPPSPSSTPRSTPSSAPRPASTRTPPTSRSRFTAELAATRRHRPLHGQPLDELVPDLIDEAVRQATWEYATTLLARHRRLRRLRRGHRPRRLRPRLAPPDAPPRHRRPRRTTTSCAASRPSTNSSSPSCTPTTTATAPPALDEPEGARVRHGPRRRHRPRQPRGTRPAHHHPGRTGPGPRLAPAPAAASRPSPRARSSTPTAPTPTPATSSPRNPGVDYCARPDLGRPTTPARRHH